MWRTTYPSLAVFAALLSATRAMADNLQCAGTGMNWYFNLVGETPCQTYQKLRQICNTQYTVGVLTINTPPDRCTDQLCQRAVVTRSPCVEHALPQQNIGDGIGIDAGAGAYTDYLESCSNPQLHAIPPNIQTAICNAHIRIEDDLYTNGFADGGWRYILSRDTILADNATANGNSFTHCPDISALRPALRRHNTVLIFVLVRFYRPHLWSRQLATNKKTLASGRSPASPSASSSCLVAATATSHGFHATQHLSITSGETLSNVYVGARGEAGPLPRSRADSEEPFLEGETDDRHHDAGPMSDVILHRSASGRLPPAYGEQI
ncbi:hypothetical protein B0H13DRAFT_2535830 [Mycena leptocephala]|nr:hypothetical protein B0H13DRAFT_2535830 [Mycena leptocephala]